MAKTEMRANAVERDVELREATLRIVQQVLERASNDDGRRSRLFPNGVGLIEVDATLDLPKFTLSVRVADVQYPASPQKAEGRLAAPETLTVGDDIRAYCIDLEKSNDPVLGDCNAFVKKVGNHFGVAIPDQNADGIVDAMKGPPFIKTTMDPEEAMAWANEGLVIAGMKRSELNTYGPHTDGHVAVVHPNADPAHPSFPMASWGKLHGHGQANASIRSSFPAKACDDNAVHLAFAKTS